MGAVHTICGGGGGHTYLELTRLLAQLGEERGLWRIPDGQIRDEKGIAWRYSDLADWEAGGSGRQTPCLFDAATGGAILSELQALVGTRLSGAHLVFAGWRVDVLDNQWRSHPVTQGVGASLGEAAARVLVYLWQTEFHNKGGTS